MGEGHHRITTAPSPDVAVSVSISVDGDPLSARAGEPIAAALHAHGRRVCRTTVRTGTPRGVFCGTGVCGDCAMQVDGIPGVRVCVTPVREGMRIETQHGLGEWRRAADASP